MSPSAHAAATQALHKNPPATGLPNIATKSSPVGRPTPLNSSTRSHGAWCEVFVDALGRRTSRFERSGKPLWIIGPDPTNVTILEVQPWTDDVIRNVGVDSALIGQHISAVPLPSTFQLLTTGLGLMALLAWHVKRRAEHQPPRLKRSANRSRPVV